VNCPAINDEEYYFSKRGACMTFNDELGSLLTLINESPESRVLDREFKPKERINLRQLESNGLIKVLSYGFDIYWTITPKGIESLNNE
jgi:hypothetical protein